MAKNVKFNLVCDKQAVRTLTDLQEHFSIEDMLNHYASGMLARWLEVRGYTAHLAAVQAIKAKDDLTIAQNLCEIFDVEDKDLAKKIENREYKARLLQQDKKAADLAKAQLGGISEYHINYNNLIQKIVDNKDDIPIIKECVEDIAKNYRNLVELDFWRLFEIMYNLAPLSVWVALTNTYLREKFCYAEEVRDVYGFNSANFYDYIRNYQAVTERNGLKRNFDHISKMQKFVEMMKWHIKTEIDYLADNMADLLPNVKGHKGQGASTWMPVQAASGKKLIIISMGDDIQVKIGPNQYSGRDIRHTYKLTDFFEYSGSEAYKIRYLEV